MVRETVKKISQGKMRSRKHLGQLWYLTVEEKRMSLKRDWKADCRVIEREPRGYGRDGFNDVAVPKAAKGQGSKEFKAAIGFRDMEVIDEQIPLLVE